MWCRRLGSCGEPVVNGLKYHINSINAPVFKIMSYIVNHYAHENKAFKIKK
jgi:hypothetical protein